MMTLRGLALARMLGVGFANAVAIGRRPLVGLAATGLLLVSPAVQPSPAKARAALSVPKARAAILSSAKRSAKTRASVGFDGYAGSWSVASVGVRDCDRLTSRIVECRVNRNYNYFPDIGPGEPSVTVTGAQCNDIFRATLKAGRRKIQVRVPSVELCHTVNEGSLSGTSAPVVSGGSDPGGPAVSGGPTKPTPYEIRRLSFRDAAEAATKELGRVTQFPAGASGVAPAGCSEAAVGIVDCGVTYDIYGYPSGDTKCRSTVRWYGEVTNGTVAPVVTLPGTRFDLAPFACAAG
jgi:hypothetical protein